MAHQHYPSHHHSHPSLTLSPLMDLAHLPPTRASLQRARRTLLRAALDVGPAARYTYSFPLKKHDSCVNALAVSNGEGRWLASAGDDMEVLVWDLHSDLASMPDKPTASFEGSHYKNVFSLAFNSTNEHLFSCGVDSRINRFDVSRLGDSSAMDMSVVDGATWRWEEHRKTVRTVSAHPTDPNLLLAASDDQHISFHDFRLPTSRTLVQSLYGSSPWMGVAWSPVHAGGAGHLFAACNEGGDLRLFDTRKTFALGGAAGSWAGAPRYVASSSAVVDYTTNLTRAHSRATRPARPDLASVAFSPDGTLLGTNMLRHCPTIYAVGDELPLAVLSGKKRPDGSDIPEGERTYSNTCTFKQAGFGTLGADGDLVFTTGSDDFYGYGWKIPSAASLAEAREVRSQPLSYEAGKDIGYTTSMAPGANVFFPVELDQPWLRLGGHNSIVNTCFLHPSLPMAITAGVECYIRIHTPFPPSSTAKPTPPSREPLIQASQAVQLAAYRRLIRKAPDAETLLFFDSLLPRVGMVELEDAVEFAEVVDDLEGEDMEEDSDDEWVRRVMGREESDTGETGEDEEGGMNEDDEDDNEDDDDEDDADDT